MLHLGADDCLELRPIQLHESLFHFYKAFYNYLAARALYFGGMDHWINVTLYYSCYYLARSVTTLAGCQSYWVRRELTGDYVEAIARSLSNKAVPVEGYRIRLQVDPVEVDGTLRFDKKAVSSHRDVWQDYHSLPFEIFNLTSVHDAPQDLIQDRNEENYSFEGAAQLDFNLPPGNFEQFFERDFVKHNANTIYDLASGGFLLAWSSQLALYRALDIAGLPIEKEKFGHMIDYCLPNSVAKEHLLLLCDEGFPTKELLSADGDEFYDEQGRVL